jgi:hypothetical protein
MFPESQEAVCTGMARARTIAAQRAENSRRRRNLFGNFMGLSVTSKGRRLRPTGYSLLCSLVFRNRERVEGAPIRSWLDGPALSQLQISQSNRSGRLRRPVTGRAHARRNARPDRPRTEEARRPRVEEGVLGARLWDLTIVFAGETIRNQLGGYRALRRIAGGGLVIRRKRETGGPSKPCCHGCFRGQTIVASPIGSARDFSSGVRRR